jgi:hypothetical protein
MVVVVVESAFKVEDIAVVVVVELVEVDVEVLAVESVVVSTEIVVVVVIEPLV